MTRLSAPSLVGFASDRNDLFGAGETTFEPDETLPLEIENAVKARVADAGGVGAIRNGDANVGVDDVTGREVRGLRGGTLEAGRSRVAWNGTDDYGHVPPAGPCAVRMETANAKLARRAPLGR